MTARALEKELEKLDAESRAKIAGTLIRSLDDLGSEEIERLWADEAERRVAEIESGKVKTIPAATVFRRLRERLA